MRFLSTAIVGAYVVEADPLTDARGSFARLYCADVFRDAGLTFTPVQTNISHNSVAATLRGLHYQVAPHGEAKLVQCVRGCIFDVAVDLRPESSSFRAVAAVELIAGCDRGFYIPDGCAHGFLTLVDESDVYYCMGSPYVAGSGRGVRWDDPALGIHWPTEPQLISPRDATYPNFSGIA